MTRVNPDMKLTPVIARGTPSERDAGDHPARAWQREMERAQMDAWLSHAVIGSSSAVQQPLMSPILAATANVATSVVTHGSGEIDFASGVPAFGMGNPAVVTAGTAALLAQGAEAANAHSHDRAASPDRSSAAAAPDAAGGSAPRETPSAAASEARESAQFEGDPSVASAHLRTAQLASQLQGLGPVESTTSVAGQVLPAPNTAAAQAAPHVVPMVAPPYGLTQGEPGPWQVTSFQWPAVPANLLAAITEPAPIAPVHCDRAIASGIAASPGEARALASGGSLTTHPTGPAAMHAAPREPIRLHADWSPEGVRLWFGMDPAAVDSLRTITAQLQRWLSVQGVRLLSISCNGTLVADERESVVADIFEADIKKGEPPAPSRSHSNLKEFPWQSVP